MGDEARNYSRLKDYSLGVGASLFGVEQLRYFRKRDNIAHYICGLCVKACPGAQKKP